MDGDHDADEVDLTGLMESVVDSDEEEDLAESIDVSLILQVFFVIFRRMDPASPTGGTLTLCDDVFVFVAEFDGEGHGARVSGEGSVGPHRRRHRNFAGIHAALASVRQHDAVGASRPLPRHGLCRRREGRNDRHERRRGARLVERHHQRPRGDRPGQRRGAHIAPGRQVNATRPFNLLFFRICKSMNN